MRTSRPANIIRSASSSLRPTPPAASGARSFLRTYRISQTELSGEAPVVVRWVAEGAALDAQSELLIRGKPNGIGVSIEDWQQELISPKPPLLRILGGRFRMLRGAPQSFPNLPAFVDPDRRVGVAPCSLHAFHEVMGDEAG